jgi:glucose-fructose oxidoreductase
MPSPLRRREFLTKSVSALGLMLAAGVKLRADPAAPSTPRRLGLAVVGLGSFAAYAMPRIPRSGRVRITGLVSGDRAKAERVAVEHGVEVRHIYSYENFDRIADDPAIEAVYLCLPVGLHAEFAIRAMRAGKHVLSEKTLAANSAQAREMIRVSRETGRHLLVAYRTYFGPAYAALHELVRSGRYGRLVHIDAHKGFRMAQPAGHWRFDPRLAGGGSLVDVGVYSVQAIRLFAGTMPVGVTAQIHSPPDDVRFRDVEDSVAFTLRFPHGITASGSSSWSYHLQNRLRLGFAEGWADLEPASPAIGHKLRLGAGPGHRLEEPPLEQVEQMPLMFDHLAAVVLDGAGPLVPATEGLKDLAIIEAIYAAAANGREVAVADPGTI